MCPILPFYFRRLPADLLHLTLSILAAPVGFALGYTVMWRLSL